MERYGAGGGGRYRDAEAEAEAEIESGITCGTCALARLPALPPRRSWSRWSGKTRRGGMYSEAEAEAEMEMESGVLERDNLGIAVSTRGV